jgi:hypothetical protein
MNLEDLGKTIAKAAPLLGAVLAGPAGASLGSIIAAKFGGSDTSPDELNALIQADPNAALKLKEIESENEIQLAQIALQHAQTTAADFASARQASIDYVKATGQTDYFRWFVGVIVMIGFHVFVFALWYYNSHLNSFEEIALGGALPAFFQGYYNVIRNAFGGPDENFKPVAFGGS